MHNSNSLATSTHYRQLSWQTKLKENRAPMMMFFVAMLLGMMASVIFPAVLALAEPYTGLTPLYFFWTFFLSLSTIFGARFIDRKFFGAMKRGIVAVEDRIVAGKSSTHVEDLEKLVAGYLKLKRLEAADFYSKKLLELSHTGKNMLTTLPDWMVTTECWASSETYHKGWNYKLVWLFETRGVLTLSPTHMNFQSKKFSFTCDPSVDIVSLELKQHPLWLKPIPFSYISITINEGGIRHTFCLTPSFGQTDTIFDCNKMVQKWYERLQSVRHNTTSPNRIPDWMRDQVS